MEDRTEQSGLAPEWFTPTGDKDRDRPRRFKLRPLNGMEALDLTAETSFDGGGLKITGKGLRSAVEMGVVDWENVLDPDGHPAKFSVFAIGRLVDAPTLHEIGMTIARRVLFTDDDAVKSSSQSKSA